MLLSKVHAFYDRVVRKPEKEPVPVEVVDSPSERVTLPLSAIEDDGDPDDAIEDDGDRSDGENWAEANEQRALEDLPAERPIILDDEPTARHH